MKTETAEIFRIRPEFTRLKKILGEAFKKGEHIKMGESLFAVIGHDSETFVLQAVNMLSPAPWTGEGLPPVGTVCEFMKHNSPPAAEGQWTVGDIRYVSDCYVIIGGDGCEHAHHPRNCSFRPARTPEQTAAEARQAAITVIENRIMARMGDLNVRNLAEDLHALLQEMAVKP